MASLVECSYCGGRHIQGSARQSQCELQHRLAEVSGDAGHVVDAVKPTMNDPEEYRRTGHEAPSNDEFCVNMDHLYDMMPSDVLEHPDWYGGIANDETHRQMLSVLRDGKRTVTLYRGVPKGVSQINRGDWVSLSCDYATEHAQRYIAYDNDSEQFTHEWSVIAVEVPVESVFTNGDSLQEWGYDGESDVTAHSVDTHGRSFV